MNLDLASKNYVTVYVRLLEEGTEVLRPVKAKFLVDDVYQLVDHDNNYDANYEVWEFPPESFVRCQRRELSGESVLIAIEKVTPPN